MTALQRRFFAAALFALAFILFYEARGEPLGLGFHREAVDPQRVAAHFWEQTRIGAFVLLLGGGLLLSLGRRLGPWPFAEGALYALLLGVLIGTWILSYRMVF